MGISWPLAGRALGMSISTQFQCKLKKLARFGNVPKRQDALIRLRRKQLTFGSPTSDLSPRSESQFAQYPGDVITSRALGDPKLGGDLAVGEAPGDQFRYLLLTLGELIQRFFGRWIVWHWGCGRGRILFGAGVLYSLLDRHGLPLRPRGLESRVAQRGASVGQASFVLHDRHRRMGESKTGGFPYGLRYPP